MERDAGSVAAVRRGEVVAPPARLLGFALAFALSVVGCGGGGGGSQGLPSGAGAGQGGLTPLTVSAITPSSGIVTGAETVVITGTGFVQGITIRFGTAVTNNVTVNGATMMTVITPAAPNGQPGIVLLDIRAPDGRVVSPQPSFTYVANRAPTLTITATPAASAGVVQIDEGQTLTVTSLATDPDVGQTRTFSLTSTPPLPPNASFDAAVGTLTFTPTAAQGPATFVTTFRVTDNGVPPASATQPLTIIVRDTIAVSGDFVDGRTFPTGDTPTRMVSADFNGDGDADLAITNAGGDDVTILLGDGQGGFDPPQLVNVGTFPFAIAAADFNRDTFTDLLVLSVGPGTTDFSFLLGNGAGGFILTGGFTVPVDFDDVATADADGDGDVDIFVTLPGDPALANDGLVVVYENVTPMGAPTLSLPPVLDVVVVGTGASSIRVADLDGANGVDIVVACPVANRTDLVLNQGGGVYSTAVPTSLTNPAGTGTTFTPVDIVVANLDATPALDVAVLTFDATNFENIDIYPNTTAGGVLSFGPPTSTGFLHQNLVFPIRMQAGDLDGDGILDLAVTFDIGSVTVAFGDGMGNVAGAFQGRFDSYQPTGFQCTDVLLPDLNGDGDLDIVATNPFQDTVTVLVNKNSVAGLAELGAPRLPISFPPFEVAVGNFDGTAGPDIIVGGDGDELTMFPSQGGRNFGPPVAIPLRTPNPGLARGILATNLDGAGGLDLVVARPIGDRVEVYFGSGTGTFTGGAADTYPMGSLSGPNLIAIGDLNGDGTADLAVSCFGRQGAAGSVQVLLGDPAQPGKLQNPIALTIPAPAVGVFLGIAVADLNRDGSADIVAADVVNDRVVVFLNSGTGTTVQARFPASSGTGYFAGPGPDGIAIGRLDSTSQDLFVCVAVASFTISASGSLAVLRADANGALGLPSAYICGVSPARVVLTDMDLDGQLDAVVTNFASSTLSVLKGDGTGGFDPEVATATGFLPVGVAITDFDADLKPDAVIANLETFDLSVLFGR